MTDQSNETSAQTPTGAPETSQSSPASGGQVAPLPDYVVTLQNQIAEMTQAFRTTQGSADAQFQQMRGDIKRILELKDSGMTETQIQRELQLDALLKTQSAQVQTPGGTGQANAGLDVNAVLTSLQFQPNDPALAALKIVHGNNPQELLKAAAGLRLSQLQTPNPTPATLPPQGNGTPPGGTDLEALATEYEQLSKNPAANFKRMTEIQQELEKIK